MKLDLTNLKESFEKLENQKIKFLFGTSKYDIVIKEKLNFYTQTFNFINSTNDKKKLHKLFEYTEDQCSKFIHICFDELKKSPNAKLDIYIKHYHLIRKYLAFLVSVFHPLYKKLELENLTLIKKAIECQIQLFNTVKEDLVIELNKELCKLRDSASLNSEKTEIFFETLFVYAAKETVNLEKVDHDFKYKYNEDVNYDDEMINEVTKMIYDLLLIYMDERYSSIKDEQLDKYLILFLDFYNSEQYRVNTFYPSIKGSFNEKIISVFIKPKVTKLFNSERYFFTLLLNNEESVITPLVTICKKNLELVTKIMRIIREYASIKLTESIEIYPTTSILFQKFNCLINQIYTIIDPIFEKYEFIAKQINEDIFDFLLPFKAEFIEWLINNIHNIIVTEKNEASVLSSFNSVSNLVKFISDYQLFIHAYEAKFKYRILTYYSKYPYDNEEIILKCMNIAYKGIITFPNLNCIMEDIRQSSDFELDYQKNNNLPICLLILNKMKWELDLGTYDNWEYFIELIKKYAPEFLSHNNLIIKVAKHYSSMGKSIAFAPSFNTFEIEIEENLKVFELVLNAWQLLILYIIKAYGFKLHIKTLEAILKAIPLKELNKLIDSFTDKNIILFKDQYLRWNFKDDSIKAGRILLAPVNYEEENIYSEIKKCNTTQISNYTVASRIMIILKERSFIHTKELLELVSPIVSIEKAQFVHEIDKLLEKELIIRDENEADLLVFNQ